MNLLCTVCARGGSKGVPGKNIRPLAGKPLIAYTIEKAQSLESIQRIIISTDSEEIADAARALGVEVPFMRPASLAGDKEPKITAIRHACLQAEEHYGQTYDAVMDLDVTAPLRTKADLENSLALYKEKQPDSLFSVVPAQRNPYFNMVEENESGYYSLCKSSGESVSSRQTAPAVYSMNASIYIYKREFLLDESNRSPFSERTLIYVMDEMTAHDIDCELDFRFIEYLMREGIWKDEL